MKVSRAMFELFVFYFCKKTRSLMVFTGSLKLLQCNVKNCVRWFWITAFAGMTRTVIQGAACG